MKIIVERNLAVPMRDGCVLRADLFRPDTPEKLPVLLNRTPYNKSLPGIALMTLDPFRAAEAGYNVMFQDCRGRFASEGDFNCFVDEARDGYDTIEWAAREPWSSGAVGTFGPSYMGATQWLAATLAPPSLKAMAPSLTASDYHDGWTYQGGAFALFFNVSWTMLALAAPDLLKKRVANPAVMPEFAAVMGSIDRMRERMDFLPLREFPMFQAGAPYFFDWLDHPAYDDYWRALSIEEHHPKITVPALNIAGWHDIFQGGSIRNYLGMKARGGSELARKSQRLVVGPWHHAVPLNSLVGQVDYGFAANPASADIDGMQLRWFDRWLKGADNGAEKESPARIFVTGVNRWRDEKDWPPADAVFTRYYLHSRGRANRDLEDGTLSVEPPGAEPTDSFVYNPLDPVPTVGGGLCCYANALQGGAFDQSAVERRDDVLVYSTPRFERDLEVVGPVTLTLYAASSAPDTDFTAKLVDVEPCGCARNLTDGIVRARWRESRSTAALMTPGKVYEFRIDLWSTANVFLAGHRLRIEVSSSNFPRFDRNLNTGAELFTDSRMSAAMQTVMHARGYASYLTLPVISRG